MKTSPQKKIEIPDCIDLTNEELLLAALESSNATITILSIDGHVIHVNRVVDGIDINKFIGTQVYNWLSNDNSIKLRESIDLVTTSKKSIEYENSFVSPVGQTHHYKHSIRPLIHEDKVASVVVVSD